MAFQLDFGAILALGSTVIIIALLVAFLLQALFLYVGVKVVKGHNDSFGEVLLTAILNFLVGLIPCIGCILQWVVINSRHETGFGNAIVAWLIAVLLPWIIVIAILFAMGISVFDLFASVVSI
ncbi:MAG: hypothetical protein Kow0069_21900 [Promethearchaeota archaeon]